MHYEQPGYIISDSFSYFLLFLNLFLLFIYNPPPLNCTNFNYGKAKGVHTKIDLSSHLSVHIQIALDLDRSNSLVWMAPKGLLELGQASLLKHQARI